MSDFDSPVGHYGRAQASRNLRSNNNNWAQDRLDTVYNPNLDYSISHWRDIDRWTSDNVRQSPYGTIQSGRSGYADMLSEGVTGPRVKRAQGMNWSAGTNFGRGSATTPQAEIGRLDSALRTAGNLVGGVGGLLGQVGAYRRNLARVNSIKAPQLPPPGSMQGPAAPSGRGSRNARGAASTTPPGTTPQIGISFPPKIDTNDTPKSRKGSRDPVGRGRLRDKNNKYSNWKNAVTNDSISFS